MLYFPAVFLCLSCCTCCSKCLTFFCCTVITSLPEANGSLVCWFCLVLFQWFFLSGRMSALCAWPSLRTLDVILSTWSLHYLLSSTMLPSRCTATWNAWLASSLKPSWNCVLKCRRLFLLSPPSSHVCRSQKKDSSTRATAAQSKGKHTKHPSAICHCSPLTVSNWFIDVVVYDIWCTTAKSNII